MQVSVTVNGAAYEREVEPRKLLLSTSYGAIWV